MSLLGLHSGMGHYSFKGRHPLAATLFLLGTAMPVTVSAVLATRSILTDERLIQAFIRHLGGGFSQSRIPASQVPHVTNLIPAYGLSATLLAAVLLVSRALWQGKKHGIVPLLGMAALLAAGSELALIATGSPIDQCFSHDPCPLDLGSAQSLLSSARYLIAIDVVLCVLTAGLVSSPQ